MAANVKKNQANGLVQEVVNGELLEYVPLGKYVVAMHDLCGGLPVIRHGQRFTRINAGVISGMLKQGWKPEQIAADFHISVEAVLEVGQLAATVNYDRSYA